MNRRGFVAGLGALAMAPPLLAQESRRHAGRMKITEVRLVSLKVVRELGTLEPAWQPGRTMYFRVGGGAFLEVRTDQGLVGIGPAIDPALMPLVQKVLVGNDPFDTEQLNARMRYEGLCDRYNGGANVDIALWDLVGKACGQPIHKLLGGGREKVGTYAAMVKLSKPEERADKAAELAAQCECQRWDTVPSWAARGNPSSARARASLSDSNTFSLPMRSIRPLRSSL